MILTEKPIKTGYGYKIKGQSPFVIIAPHAGGDDLKSGLIAKKIAKKLNGFLVVNKNFIKPSNTHADKNSSYALDFNKLCWCAKKGKYLWKKRPSLKLFFQDIADYCDQAKKHSRENKAIAVYIHSLRDKNIGIDLGVGLKSIKDKNNRFIFSFKDNSQNSGIATIKLNQIKKIKKLFEKNLSSRQLLVSVGKVHSGWSKSSAIQFHKHEGRKDYALQIEISKSLRDTQENRCYTSNLTADILQTVFIK